MLKRLIFTVVTTFSIEILMTKLSVLFSFLIFSITGVADLNTSTHAKNVHKDNEQLAKKVIMFSATYCPNCLSAKKFLSAENIPFMEFDIETSAAARNYFDKLGGRGTPFLVVNNHPMQGFNQQTFWRHYKNDNN
ncbi:MAG: glutaredoxin [Oleiphilaceae bacterium]